MPGGLTIEHYRDLAEFRRQIRKFLHFSETAAKERGIEPAQHQMLLAVRGLPEGVKPTIRELASRLYLHHHSAVELVDRLEASGAVKRVPGSEDRREVRIHLTDTGLARIDGLTQAHREELETSGPDLARALASVLRHSRKVQAH